MRRRLWIDLNTMQHTISHPIEEKDSAGWTLRRNLKTLLHEISTL